MLQAVAGKGKPVITVFVAGRPLFVNDLLNMSDAFVAAWLPGSEGKGVADLLIGKRYDFTGKLSFSWPKSACQTELNAGQPNYTPLFGLGYGLRKGQQSRLGQLDASFAAGGCGVSNIFPVFSQADRTSYPLAIRSGAEHKALGADLNSTFSLPGISAQTTQVNTQQDAKQFTWSGPASFEAKGSKPMVLSPQVLKNGVLRFDVIVSKAPAGPVSLSMQGVALDATALFKRLLGQGRQMVKIPLACFTAKGVDLAKVDTPFSVKADAPFAAAFTNITIVGSDTVDVQAVTCESMQ